MVIKSSHYVKPLSFLIWTILVQSSVYSQTIQLAAEQTKILDSVYDSYITHHQVPGFSIGILVEDSTVYSRGFGVRSLKTREPVLPNSLFHTASISKTFVATAIMQLAEVGQIAIDTPLIRYLPYFKLKDDEYKDITIFQMLTHTSGLPDVKDYEWNRPQYDEGALERYVRSLTRERMAFEPGDDFGYSNMAYDILGDVIAKVSGIPFEEYMMNNILRPSKMVSSTFKKEEVPPELATIPHVKNKKGQAEISNIYPYNRQHAPSSTLHSNAEDLLRWARIMLHDGAIGNGSLLSPDIFRKMTTPHYEVNEFTRVGLSWFIHTDNEAPYIFHMGGDTGYNSIVCFYPQESIAIVILSNCDYFPLVHAASTAYRILHGNEPLGDFENLLFIR